MMKLAFVAACAAVVGVSEAGAQSLVQRSDWQDRKLERSLPRINPTVPWLDIDTKTRMPKGDIPLGRAVASVNRYVLPSHWDVQMSTNSLHFREHVAMQDGKWTELDLRQPGTRRILEALRQIEAEAPGLLEHATFAEMARGHGNGGHVPQ